MKAKEVLKLLKISRPTLSSYVKNNKLKVKSLVNGFYDYDEESVFKLLNKELIRYSAIYARVSTNKQKKDLENQVEVIEQFCHKNGIKINDVYKEVGSGINFDRKEFQRLLNDVIQYKVNKVFITYKDRLSRISFKMFDELFKKFNCEIIVLNDIDDSKLIEKEIFEEIINLIHCFSMKMYSNRRKEKLKMLEKELTMENDLDAIS